jgi:F0F1-type ATP synthase assembly protein I
MGLIATVALAVHKHSLNTAFSGIAGLFLAIAPTVVYARIAFADQLVVTPGVAFARHKKAMLWRFLLNLVLFAVVLFLYKKCDYIALFVAYFITLAGYWVSLVKS